MSESVDEFQVTINEGSAEPEVLLAMKSQLAQLNGKLERFQVTNEERREQFVNS